MKMLLYGALAALCVGSYVTVKHWDDPDRPKIVSDGQAWVKRKLAPTADRIRVPRGATYDVRFVTPFELKKARAGQPVVVEVLPASGTASAAKAEAETGEPPATGEALGSDRVVKSPPIPPGSWMVGRVEMSATLVKGAEPTVAFLVMDTLATPEQVTRIDAVMTVKDAASPLDPPTTDGQATGMLIGFAAGGGGVYNLFTVISGMFGGLAVDEYLSNRGSSVTYLRADVDAGFECEATMMKDLDLRMR